MPEARYTHGYAEPVLRSHRWRTAANSAAYLLPRLRPDHRILDVGCGPGTITAELAGLVPDGHVTALEPSPEAIEEARAAAFALGLTNLDFVATDLHGARLPDNAYDVVHAHQVLQHVADPVAVLVEMRRVCRPDGVVAVRDADYGGFTWWPELPGLSEWNDLYHRVAHANGGEPDAGRRLLSWAHAAGFTEVAATASVWCFAEPEDRAWWGGMWADRITGSAIADQALASGLATHADLHRIEETWRKWAAADDGWLVIPHGELLARP